jgi:hypothetical protein
MSDALQVDEATPETIVVQGAELPESTAKKRDRSLVATSARAWMDTARFDQGYRVANAMAYCGLTPKHLIGSTHKQTAANCMRLVMQAEAWEMDPWALMDVSFLAPGGKIGYEGKLIMAVINTRAPLEKRLSFAFEGEGKRTRVTVSATFKGEQEPRTLSGNVGDWFKSTCQMWSGPQVSIEQKLVYTAALWWARRHWPEGVLGVCIREELDYPDWDHDRDPPPPKNVTPPLVAIPAAVPPEELVSLGDLSEIVDPLRELLGDATKAKLDEIAAAAGVASADQWPAARRAELENAVEAAILEIEAYQINKSSDRR